MPTVQYTNLLANISRTSSMPTPKRITELRHWLRGAQTAIREIPRNIAEAQSMAIMGVGHDGWYVQNSDVSQKWIKFNIENRFGERAHIVIDRTPRGLGF